MGGSGVTGWSYIAAALGADEVGTIDGVPVTSPVRTVIGPADMASTRDIEHPRRGGLPAHRTRGLAVRHGRRGAGRLGAVLVEHDPGSTLTRSELEDWLLAFCRRHRFDTPAVNAYVEGYEVDFSWAKQRLVVEADGRQSHDTRRGFENDRAHDAHLLVAGWRVLRVTRRRLRREEAILEGQLRMLLG